MDLRSQVPKGRYRFDSGPGHHSNRLANANEGAAFSIPMIRCLVTRRISKSPPPSLVCEPTEWASQQQSGVAIPSVTGKNENGSRVCNSALLVDVPTPLDVYSQLLGFLVEVASLESKRPGGIRNVVIVPLEFPEDGFTLEALDAVGQWA